MLVYSLGQIRQKLQNLKGNKTGIRGARRNKHVQGHIAEGQVNQQSSRIIYKNRTVITDGVKKRLFRRLTEMWVVFLTGTQC